ncbi:M15 family metallopeptidase [Pseudodesulfovibrio tunisiensis]|uniref:M15 family metallopeptidase n=1 Tax=Pseudodesulfovibrio tunisiensis TaxID=463192 RepID=UPI001FB335F1|nr:M15 family metallopeptidase [Pseudodesulfovibrio tunisiensis]
MPRAIEAPAIPDSGAPSWDTVFTAKIREGNERFVPLSLAQDHILVRPAYFVAGINGAVPECYAREGIRQRLLKANSLLPKGMRLIILDTWRGKDVQTELFRRCAEALTKAYPDRDATEIEEMTSEFVARPSVDPTRPSPHSTGGAVDLTIATTDGAPLFFGAPFDYPGPVSNTRYFEEKLERGEKLDDNEQAALKNRRLLYDVMIQSGFVNYHGEWWHFEYGTQRWAYVKGEDHAFYGVKRITMNSFEAFNNSRDSSEIVTLLSAGG